MSEILLSIKPEYVERILQKKKTYEFRKRLPACNVDVIHIYCTYPVMKVVAKVRVTEVLKASPTSLWEKTKHCAGISRSNYRQYFRGCKIAYAFSLGELTVFDSPKDINEYGLSAPPQSFVYVARESV